MVGDWTCSALLERDKMVQKYKLGRHCETLTYFSQGFPIPMYAIYGNHEDWRLFQPYLRFRWYKESHRPFYDEHVKIRNFHPLETGKVYEIQGIRIMGINGIWAKTPRKVSHYLESDVDKCKDKEVDIFLSHEPPKGIVDYKRNINMGRETIKEIIESLDFRYAFFGHIHTRLHTANKRKHYITLPRINRGFYILEDMMSRFIPLPEIL